MYGFHIQNVHILKKNVKELIKEEALNYLEVFQLI